MVVQPRMHVHNCKRLLYLAVALKDALVVRSPHSGDLLTTLLISSVQKFSLGFVGATWSSSGVGTGPQEGMRRWIYGPLFEKIYESYRPPSLSSDRSFFKFYYL